MSMPSSRVLLVLVAFACLAPSRAYGAEWITFDSPAVSRTPADRGADPVRAYLALPVDRDRYPGVVLLSGCGGQRPYHQSWARALAGHGYAALLVDHFFMHDRANSCGARIQIVDREMRVRHARAAIAYLSHLEGVDASRIALMGWEDAPLRATVEDPPSVAAQASRVAAVVAVTPDSCPDASVTSPIPWLALLEDSRDGAGTSACTEPAANVGVVLYAGTARGFDDPRASELSASGRRARVGRRYDRAAHAKAIQDVTGFLDRHLRRGWSPREVSADAAAPATRERGTWAVDPSYPGPDLPPRGASLFDRVFSTSVAGAAVFELPFPFERLLARLADEAGAGQMSRAPLDFALIPLGRSLQREAAAPNYFESPRVVVAVTGEPAAGPLPRFSLVNRLFIGYQPRAGVLEVVSYNEEANRFEFQVVRNYRAGATPEVRYAKRALCTSCHQNAAPIFAEASWDETNANSRIVAHLGALGGRFHGVEIREDDRGVAAIDSATDDANLLTILQRLWDEGCTGDTRRDTAACRAGALQSMLQYRLSEGAGFDRSSTLYTDGYLAVQRASWQRRWPDGLLVPASTLPDRAPLMQPVPAAVAVTQDPLRPRPPATRWSGTETRDLERMIRGLSRALPGQHLASLETRLHDLDAAPARRGHGAHCAVERRGMGQGMLHIECAPHAGDPSGFAIRSVLSESSDGRVEGNVSWVELADSIYARLRAEGTVEHDGDARRLVLRLSRRSDDAPVRAPTGDALDSLTLRWSRAVGGDARQWEARGEIRLLRDFEPVRVVLSRAAAEPEAGSPLSRERFDARALSSWLLESLGVPPNAACCATQPTPRPTLDAESSATATSVLAALEHAGPVQTFELYCAACHGAETRFPPGFLHAGARRDAIAHCAERIFYRLSMWQRAPAERGSAPMPPAQGLRLAGTDAERWRQSAALARLIAYARKLVEEQGSRPDAVLERPYRENRACLPEPTSVSGR